MLDSRLVLSSALLCLAPPHAMLIGHSVIEPRPIAPEPHPYTIEPGRFSVEFAPLHFTRNREDGVRAWTPGFAAVRGVETRRHVFEFSS